MINYPAFSFTCLADSVILFLASAITFYKLYRGSKSNFAYLLIGFTFANALSRLTIFIIFQISNNKVELNGENSKIPDQLKLPNGYAWLTNVYFYNLLSLQCWIFGLKYLWSATFCSLEETRLSLACIKYTGWIGGLCYVVFMITCWFILMVTFPGYSDMPKFKEWIAT